MDKLNNLRLYIVSYDLLSNKNLKQKFTAHVLSGSTANISKALEDRFGKNVSNIRFETNHVCHLVTDDVELFYAKKHYDRVTELKGNVNTSKSFNSEFKESRTWLDSTIGANNE